MNLFQTADHQLQRVMPMPFSHSCKHINLLLAWQPEDHTVLKIQILWSLLCPGFITTKLLTVLLFNASPLHCYMPIPIPQKKKNRLSKPITQDAWKWWKTFFSLPIACERSWRSLVRFPRGGRRVWEKRRVPSGLFSSPNCRILYEG